jgi:hypothetical protein
MDEGQARFERLRALVAGRGPINEAFVLEEAGALAAAGDARAARLMANICGCGFGCAVDWEAALRWLGVAAEAGDQDARAQLRLLARTEDGDDWALLARTADIAAWRKARVGEPVCDDPRVLTIREFLDVSERDWVVARARPILESSLVYDPTTGRPVRSDARTNSAATFSLATLDLPLLLIRERIAASVGAPPSHLERVSVFHYEVGQRFAPHADYLAPSPQLDAEIATMGQRPLTFLVYLNDNFEGGDTHFTEVGRRFRCGAGGALYFHNLLDDGALNPRSFHEGAAPTRGEKWLMSQFIRDKPQLPG